MNSHSPICWTPTSVEPTGADRKVLVWVKFPLLGRPSEPGPAIALWKGDLGCFCIKNILGADNLITHWSEINDPNQ